MGKLPSQKEERKKNKRERRERELERGSGGGERVIYYFFCTMVQVISITSLVAIYFSAVLGNDDVIYEVIA